MDREHTYTKRGLVALSHAMENSLAVGSSQGAGPTGLIIGLFQDRAYFDVERDRFGRLAAGDNACIVGFVGRDDDLPHAVHAVTFPADDPLAREWSLVILSEGAGTSLVAHDLGDLANYADTLESGRLFRAQWSFNPHTAADEADRLLEALAPRLTPDVVERARAAVAEARRTELSPTETRLAAVAEMLVAGIDAAYSQAELMERTAARERELAQRDALTGLGNRRFLDRFLGSVEGPQRIATLMIDIDDLKVVNDVYGHVAGDKAIVCIAEALMEVTRPQDVLVRFGGDEFVLLLPGLGEAEALAVGQRIVERVNGKRLDDPLAGVVLGVSVGVRVSSTRLLEIESLDVALYSAKRSGKGRAHLLAS